MSANDDRTTRATACRIANNMEGVGISQGMQTSTILCIIGVFCSTKRLENYIEDEHKGTDSKVYLRKEKNVVRKNCARTDEEVH